VGGGRGKSASAGRSGLQGSATEQTLPLEPLSLRSSLPFPTADPEPERQHQSKNLLKVGEFNWEQARSYLAFGIVSIVLVYFLFAEVYTMMSQPGYFVTGGFRVCQTGIFGAVGFVASEALRNSDESNADEKIRDEATLIMASMAFQASPTAMAITDARGRIEKCNPAFVRITSPSPEDQLDRSNLSPAPTACRNMPLETALGLIHDEDAERLQRCINECQSAESYCHEGDSATKSDDEFLVQGRTLSVRVSLASGVPIDAEQAMVPPSVLGFLSETAKLSTRRPESKRYVVVIHDVTFDRSLVRAIDESTAAMRNGKNEPLRIREINSTMQSW
jgi:PAS domain-containing protein